MSPRGGPQMSAQRPSGLLRRAHLPGRPVVHMRPELHVVIVAQSARVKAEAALRAARGFSG